MKRLTELQYTHDFVAEECCSCFAPFAMSAEHYRLRKEDKKSFWCPACGTSMSYRESESARRIREAEQRADTAVREAATARGQLRTVTRQAEKMRKRIRNGLCPCCRRNFPSLGEHIRKQHPEFGNAESLRAVRELFGMTQFEVADVIGVTAAHVGAFENSKPLVAHAKQRIETWVHSQVA